MRARVRCPALDCETRTLIVTMGRGARDARSTMNVEIIRFLKHLTSPAVRALLFVSLATTPAAAMPTITSPEWIPGFDMLGRGNLLGGRVTFETDEAARPTVIVESATRRFVGKCACRAPKSGLRRFLGEPPRRQ